MLGLPEQAEEHLAADLGVAGGDVGHVLPAPGVAQRRVQGHGVDGVIGAHVGRGDQARAGGAGAQGEVGVLAGGDGQGVVEAAQLLEQGERVDDVAGLAPGVGRVDALGQHVGGAEEQVALVGVGLGGALDDRAGRGPGGAHGVGHPVAGRAAVVVGEGHQRGARGAPARVALGGGAGPGGEAHVAKDAGARERVVAQQRLGLVAGVVG